jgi:2-oxoisovalerate dehydrogenase E2 component (dihydrolipoyl transacylase)
MGRFVFRLPDIGEGVAEAEITAWYVNVGDKVGEDQALCDVLTDKATVDMTSPVAGTITALHGTVGEMRPVGAPLVEFEVEGEAPREAGRTAPAQPAPQPVEAKPEKPAPAADEQTAAAPVARTSGQALAAPAVRARAKTLGIDLASIAGSGPEGRVTHADLDAKRGGSAPVSTEPHPAAGHAGGADVTAVPIIGLRRRIAETMAASKRSIPHFGYVEEVDVTALEDMRARVNAAGGTRLTLLPFFARAVIEAVAGFPQINAVFDDQAGVVYQHKAVHLGIATQTPTGLMVAVVRDAEQLSIRALAEAIVKVSGAAKDGSAKREDLSGSTITVSSLGTLGGISAMPVINRPEVAILAPNRLREQVVMRGGVPTAVKVMNVSTAFDHRIVDGFDAASFVAKVKEQLESPGLLLLG